MPTTRVTMSSILSTDAYFSDSSAQPDLTAVRAKYRDAINDRSRNGTTLAPDGTAYADMDDAASYW